MTLREVASLPLRRRKKYSLCSCGATRTVVKPTLRFPGHEKTPNAIDGGATTDVVSSVHRAICAGRSSVSGNRHSHATGVACEPVTAFFSGASPRDRRLTNSATDPGPSTNQDLADQDVYLARPTPPNPPQEPLSVPCGIRRNGGRPVSVVHGFPEHTGPTRAPRRQRIQTHCHWQLSAHRHAP